MRFDWMWKHRKIQSCDKPKIRLLGSGAILNEALKASDILKKYDIESEIWSVTSFNLLRKNGMEIERINQLDPLNTRLTYVEECFGDDDIPVIAASDYMRAYAEQIRPYIHNDYTTLGTDGYGRSDSRKNLRKFFEVDKEHIVAYSLSVLAKEQLIPSKYAAEAINKFNIDPKKPFPAKL